MLTKMRPLSVALVLLYILLMEIALWWDAAVPGIAKIPAQTGQQTDKKQNHRSLKQGTTFRSVKEYACAGRANSAPCG